MTGIQGEQDQRRGPSAAPPGPASGQSFPVVALGASAGGLEVLRHFFAHLPDESGMAFVVILHLDPARPSMLAKVLKGKRHLEVVEAEDRMALEPNRVHVIPSEADLAVRNGVLTLVPRHKTGHLHLPIDSFFRCLADDAHDRAIGVVLSGSGADGTDGLRAIKAAGGIAIAQEPSSAQFASMPQSAIDAGVVDFRGSPEAIASELVRLGRHPYIAAGAAEVHGADEPDTSEGRSVEAILAALRRHVGMDFSGYKRTTVLRRIERRMALRHVWAIGEYAKAVQDDLGEAHLLAQGMLVHVTSFFRDPVAFEAVKRQVFEPLVKSKAAGESVRIWVPGCSTGEEAYGLAIGLLETLDGQNNDLTPKIFGTDLSDEAIDIARLGAYSESALVDLSPERRDRFFERGTAGFHVARAVRDRCVFVKHDLIRDPPFAKMDLISCRNVLIYFDAELQREVIPMLHYCLSPGGFLFLGQSEAVTGFRDLFDTVDREHRIFVKSGDSVGLLHTLRSSRDPEKLTERRRPEREQGVRDVQRQADHLLLSRYAPPGVIVNDRFEIIQFRGRTGLYLEPPPGQPQTNILRMARGGLAAHLHDALERAKSERVAVRKEGLHVPAGSGERVIDVEVVPLPAVGESSGRHFLVLFEPVAGTVSPSAAREADNLAEQTAGRDGWEKQRLEAELDATKDYLQSVISEQQTTTDELASANDDLIAANEELQSTNEELQSAKEELQSTNEELSTVNEQLRHRNAELDHVASDLANVLASVEIPVIIVDLDLRVRRFTPTVGNIAHFIPEDVGRPIEGLKLKVDVDGLAGMIQSVLDTMTPRSWDVRGEGGRWYQMQIRPYRASDNRLDGAVLSFADVDQLRRAIQDAEGARDYARSIVETVSSALVVLDSELRVVSANLAFYDTFSLSSSVAEGKQLWQLSGGIWAEPALQEALRSTVRQREPFAALEIPAHLGRGGPRQFSVAGRPIVWGNSAPLVLVAIDDVTALRTLESERSQLLASEKQARVEAERATRAKDVFLATLSHELRTPLSSILMSAQLLRQQAASSPEIERPSAAIERAAIAQAKLIDDLLDVSRIVSGKLMLDLGPVDFREVVREAVELNQPAALAKGVELEASLQAAQAVVYGDQTRLLQVVNNLLTNAVKFTPRGGRIDVELDNDGERLGLTVKDTGMGIRADVLPTLFGRFVQADSSVTRTHGGLGLGLSIVRHLVDVHGGDVQVDSPGDGQGTTFRVTLPAGAAAAQDSPTARRTAAESVEGVRVLLVEDDDDTREACAAMLAGLGTDVRAEPSADRALATLETFRPNVILSDIAMPGGDGFSFMKQVRKLPASRGGRVPAAAITALAGDADRRRALEAGYQLHVAKPVEASRLASVVTVLAHWNERKDSFTESGQRYREGTEPESQGAAGNAVESDRQPLRILVVEDDELIASTFPRLLGNRGHDARSARSGREAVEVSRSFQPDVVLLDLGLPDIDGYEVGRTLRQERADRPLLVVAVSGSELDREALDKAGIDEHLLKPIGVDEVHALVGRWQAKRARE